MTNSKPSKLQILDGSSLKLIASLWMLTNHAANAFNPITGKIVFTAGGFSISLVRIIYYLSRICFPIYAFLIVEGFTHTHDRKKYGMNLFLFALISEIPWNLEHSGTLFYEKQNVMFTLLFGYLGLCVFEKFKEEPLKQSITLLFLFVLSIVFKADYGYTGFAFILMLYALRNVRILQAVVGCTILSTKWIAGLAFIPINMYSGKRGFADNKFFKYAFYVFYPLHLLVIFLIKHYTIGY